MKFTRSLWLALLFNASFFATEGTIIVYPKMLESRSEDGVKILKISDGITLNLRKCSVFPKEFMIHTTEDGQPVAYHMLGSEMEKNLYDDIGQMAAVHVSEEDGVKVEGVLGHTLRIKPLEGSERSFSGGIPHELYEIPDPTSKLTRDDYSIPNISARERVVESRTNWYKSPRLPLLINPELHVVVDYAICKLLKFVVKKIAQYVAIMTASANLRYRSMIQPRVQLLIVGVTVTRTQEEEPYMFYVPEYRATNNILHQETRVNFRKHVMQKTYFAHADVVFLLSGLNFSVWEGSVLQTWVGGSAYLGGVCTEYKVGISQDTAGSYFGVHVYAHEIAHSLGCQHDGEGADSWVYGNIGSKDCDWNNGYIMSYKHHEYNRFRFSECCKREITNMYNRPEYRCLIQKNRLNTGIYTSKLPGTVMSRQKYCELMNAEYTYVKLDKTYKGLVCVLKCFLSRNGQSRLLYAVDGATCSKGKFCVLGNCTSKAELKRAE
ncbi:venom metalloproteinase antarease-like TtrivMP_A [Rhipicephalus sanguineus]|uniref:venom metalloproteinase antarease-like TtrivMP_A n=1 Tax=Rhipicephalus sanguineus TaxID=34632 RepID=UPI00189317FD|nr:venom metalloproteinase antarease-like TtrivMP_A [Rhipicephalus sanguineus]